MTREITPEEIDTTFEEIDRFEWARRAFRGTHSVRGNRYRIVRDYVVEHGTEYLEVTDRYYVAGDLVAERADWWPVDRKTDTIARCGTPIEAFCREHHERDRETEFERVLERGPTDDDPFGTGNEGREPRDSIVDGTGTTAL